MQNTAINKMTSNIPFGDPLWLNRTYSPYYTASHRRLQKEVRSYVDTHIAPYCDEWEKQGVVPQEVSHFPPLLESTPAKGSRLKPAIRN